MTATSDPVTVSPQQLRTMSLAARLYYSQSIRQREIADRLGVSQARVSRLLRQAEDHGIVRTILTIPEGLHPDLEEQLEQRYGVPEVHVVEVPAADEAVPYALGWAAARFLSGGTLLGPTVGFTSWSTTLQEMASALDDGLPRTGVEHVVEMLGDLGPPAAQHAAARATARLAEVVGGEPVFLRTPGVFATPELRETAVATGHVRRALGLLDRLDVAFVGVGPALPHSQLQPGSGFFTADQLGDVRTRGGVGQLNQRYLDADGEPVTSSLDDLVVGVSLAQLRQARRRVVIAGGHSKYTAIAAALRGRWVDTLMTDVRTARHLLAAAGSNSSCHPGQFRLG